MKTSNHLSCLPALLRYAAISLSSVMLLFLFVSSGQAQSFSNQLTRIGHSSLPGNKIQVTLEFVTALSITPPHFSTDNPARIVLDFPGMGLDLMERSVTVGVGAVQQVRAVETNNRVRVVLNLLRMTQFDIQVVGNKVFISVDPIVGFQNPQANSRDPIARVLQQSDTAAAAAAPQRTAYAPPPAQTMQPIPLTPQPVATMPAAASMPLPAGPAIANVDFRRYGQGAGWVVISLTDPDIVISMTRGQRAQDVELVFRNTQLPAPLDRRLDVSDFATPVSAIDTYPQGQDSKMLITMREGVLYEYSSTRTGREYIVEIKERVLEEAAGGDIAPEERTYTGRNVNFNFQDIQVRSALNLLLSPEVSGETYNVVITEDVDQSEKLSLRLQNVPWDQALDIILEAKGLAKKEFGQNVLIIDTKQNLDKRETEELEAEKKIEELEPVRTQYIQINYATAEEIVNLLQSNNSSDRGHRFISERGSISFDERTNTLIIQETDQKLTEIRQLVEAIDTPSRQVLIESRVVIAQEDFTKNLGVKFGYSLNQDLGGSHGVVIGGKMEGDTVYSGGTGFTTGNTSPAESGFTNTEGQENFIVRLPASDPAGALGLAIGKIGSYLLQLELAASQSEGTSEILATPKVITANQRKAVILQGERIPYRTVSNQGTQTEFQDAVLKLEVKPQITPDERIIMELLVTSDEVGQQILTTGERAIFKREVQTEVLVDNGETVVLGGVFQHNRSNNVTRVPFFSELPLVGNLFKSSNKEDRKRELLIFVTPRIVRERS